MLYIEYIKGWVVQETGAVYVVRSAPQLEMRLVLVKDTVHRLSHLRRDTLELGMDDPVSSSISGQRKVVLDAAVTVQP